ncbi:MAG: MTH938/NDUFAF3 family protein [Acidimicrobiia bacterium]
MPIQDFEYGRIVIDGREEHRDLIITRSGLLPNWWRREGHLLVMEDLESILDEPPAVLVVGTGTTGNMRTAPGLVEELAARGVETEVMPTAQAVRRFNELLGLPEVDAAAALHLTC